MIFILASPVVLTSRSLVSLQASAAGGLVARFALPIERRLHVTEASSEALGSLHLPLLLPFHQFARQSLWLSLLIEILPQYKPIIEPPSCQCLDNQVERRCYATLIARKAPYALRIGMSR
jgi:hypothetical protein